ncbi:MAG: urea ABC transporter ATP-binding subunit UrtE [Betaproteobacteria bacterium]|nr:urea ABC transporter ATP-binding subunit UrtE [Betaproteobacteria bacterium]
MLNVTQLNQYYGSSHILRNVNLHVAKGSCTAIMGRNGVGKTTLLKCLMGVVPIKSGSIGFEDREIGTLLPYERVRLGIGYVPQGRDIFGRLTVEENLIMGLATGTGSKLRDVPERVFELFPVLKQMLKRRGGDLSGGQQQQLAIARALVSNPKLLILDEPTEGIQPSIIKDIEHVIARLTEQAEMAILLVEQYFDFAKALAGQYVILRRGEVVKQGLGKDMDKQELRAYLAV